MAKFKKGDIVRYEYEHHYLELSVEDPEVDKNRFAGLVVGTSDESIWKTGTRDLWIEGSFHKVINADRDFEEALKKLEACYGKV